MRMKQELEAAARGSTETVESAANPTVGPESVRLRGRFQGIRLSALHRGWLKSHVKKQGGTCGICGGRLAKGKATLDHIIPISRGGPDHYENTRATHYGCNQRKGNALDTEPPAGRWPVNKRVNGARIASNDKTGDVAIDTSNELAQAPQGLQ